MLVFLIKHLRLFFHSEKSIFKKQMDFTKSDTVHNLKIRPFFPNSVILYKNRIKFYQSQEVFERSFCIPAYYHKVPQGNPFLFTISCNWL